MWVFKKILQIQRIQNVHEKVLINACRVQIPPSFSSQVHEQQLRSLLIVSLLFFYSQGGLVLCKNYVGQHLLATGNAASLGYMRGGDIKSS